LTLRRTCAPLAALSKAQCDVVGLERDRAVLLRRRNGGTTAAVILNFNTAAVAPLLPLGPGRWRKALDSNEPRWNGAGATLPAEFECEEITQLHLPASTAALFVKIHPNDGKARHARTPQ
jgi:hypothetical protein